MSASTRTRTRQYLSTILFVFGGVSASAQTASLQSPDSLADRTLDRACYVELSNPAANRLACQDALDDAVLDDIDRPEDYLRARRVLNGGTQRVGQSGSVSGT